MTEQLILAEVQQLPERLQVEVLHFVTFLKREYGQETGLDTKPGRVFGRSAGKYKLAADFDAPLADFTDYM